MTIKGDLSKATDEDALPLVEKRLGVMAENTGGGVMCFVFYGSQNDKKTDLYFGWMEGNLGFNLMDDGDVVEAGELAADSDADAQADFIMATCKRLGFKVEEAK